MTMDIGFIGTGSISRGHIKRTVADPSARVAALCDVNTETMEERTELLEGEAPFYNDYKVMVEEESLDAVIICTPHTLHFEQAVYSMQKGLHVLIEKPMVCRTERAKKIISMSEELDRVLMVRFQRHYKPPFRWARQYIEKGKLGEVFHLTGNLGQDWAWRTVNTWRGRKDLSGGGMLMDSGSHILDVLCWVSGLDPAEVCAFVSNRFASDEEVDILSSISVRFSNRALASIAVNGNNPQWEESLSITGTKGKISWDGRTMELVDEEGEKVKKGPFPEEGSADENFFAVIEGREQPESKGSDALKVIQIQEAAYRSQEEERLVKVDEL